MKTVFFRFLLSSFGLFTSVFLTSITGQPCMDGPCINETTTINVTQTSALQPGNSVVSFSNQTIRINTLITVNKSITFTNCTIIFSSGAGFVINASYYLSASCSAFKGCNNIWNGVNLNKNARIQVDNCLFQDATNAINFYSGYSLSNLLYKNTITNTHFKNNGVGISVGSSFGTSVNIGKKLTLYGNQFYRTSTGSLFSYDASVGMRLGRSVLGIFGSEGAKNKMYDIIGGIQVNRSCNVEIYNFEFKNIKGNAITSASGTSAIIGGDSWKECHFYDIYKSGILANNPGVLFKVYKCKFENSSILGEFGIQIKPALRDVKLEISENILKYHERSISFDRPQNLGLPNVVGIVRGNIIDDFKEIGIDCYQSAAYFPKGSCKIQTNQVRTTLLNPSVGIRCSGAQTGLSVVDNDVEINTEVPVCHNCDYSAWGIAFLGCASDSPERNITALQNRVSAKYTYNGIEAHLPQGANSFSHLQCGIHTERSSSVIIDRNTVANCMRDFHFQDVNNVDWKCNLMKRARSGLQLWGLGISKMGDQNVMLTSNRNIWDPSSDFGKAAWASNNSGTVLTDFGDRVYYIDDNTGNKPPSIHGPQPWFQPSSEYTLCGSLVSTPDVIHDFLYIDNLDSRLISNDQGLSEYDRWNLALNLLRKVNVNPSLLSHPGVAAWLGSPVGTLANNFQQALNQSTLTGLDNPTFSQYCSVLNTVRGLQNSLISSTEIEDMEDVYLELETATAQLDSLSQLVLIAGFQQREHSIASLQNMTGLSSSFQKGSKYRLLAELCLVNQRLASTLWEDETYNKFQELIPQLIELMNCPASMLSLDATTIGQILFEQGYVESPITESDLGNCTSVQDRNQSETHSIKVAPNPTAGLVSFYLTDLREDLQSITVLSLDGKPQSVKEVSRGSDWITLDVTGLSNGVYLVNLVKLDGGTTIVKLMVHQGK